jgi:hypothetical protein
MKASRIFIAAALIVLFLLPGCSDNSQSPVDASLVLQKEVIANFSLTGYSVELIEPGTIKVVGNNIIVKDQVVKLRVDSDNLMVNGFLILDNNGSLNIYTGEGHIYGKITIIPDVHPDGEMWTGNFTGTRVRKSETEWNTFINERAKGYNGALEGLHLYADEVAVTNHIYGETGFLSTGTGYIK